MGAKGGFSGRLAFRGHREQMDLVSDAEFTGARRIPPTLDPTPTRVPVIVSEVGLANCS